MSRKAERIPKVLALIKEYWTKYPDARLAQIICNLSSNSSDPYYLEDDKLMERLEERLALFPKDK
jgi:uncharacterized protein YihD (DUF1040 family)